MRTPLLALPLLTLATLYPFNGLAQNSRYYADEVSALRAQNRTLQARVDSLERALDKAKGEAYFVDWDELDGIENEEAAFYGTSNYGERLTVEDNQLAAKIRLAAPFLIIPYRQVVKEYIDFYSIKKRKSMSGILRRYDKALPVMLPIFRKYGVPDEIVALCIVESAVSAKAHSKAGAHGYWQFMPATATEYGLSVEPGVDEREDLVKSTDAAARYLSSAYRTLGSWDLAVSSYNCGIGNINRAIIKSGRKTDYWSVYEYLPKETKGYLLSLLAVRYIINNRTELGF